jgi:hypothetical protein
MKVSFCPNFFHLLDHNILLLDINISPPFVYHYETISSSPVQSLYENNTQQQHPTYVSFESNSPYKIRTISQEITPRFQRKFPIVSVAILGFFEFFSGLIVLALELLIFDITLGLWCGVIYALAGAAIIVLGLFTNDIFQFLF